jgi:methyl coenzyme M reductase subunit C
MGSVYGLQFNQVYNMIYHELRNQEIREHNQVRVRLIDKDGNLLTNIDNPAINLCVKPASI